MVKKSSQIPGMSQPGPAVAAAPKPTVVSEPGSDACNLSYEQARALHESGIPVRRQNGITFLTDEDMAATDWRRA